MHPVIIALIVGLVVASLIGLGFLVFGKSSPSEPAGCKFASDCSGNTPICKASKCVKCTAQNKCPASKPVCSDDGACIVCALDSDCGQGEQCKNGDCVPRPCADDEECPPGEACDNGKCVPTPCDGDAGCEKPLVCERGQCTFVCEENSDCKDGETCRGNRCGPTPCAQNVDCPPGSGLVCKEGKCVRDCSTDAECKEGYVCDEGRCMENFICNKHADCGEPGTYCVQGLCVRPCIGDALCPSGSECIEGYCQRTRLPCPAGSFLQRGYCIKSLCNPSQDSNCKDGFITQECKSNADLRNGAICVHNKSFNPPCAGFLGRNCGELEYSKDMLCACGKFFTTSAKTKPSKADDRFLIFEGGADKTSCLQMCKSNKCGMAWTDVSTNPKNCLLWSTHVNKERQAHPTGETHVFTFNPFLPFPIS